MLICGGQTGPTSRLYGVAAINIVHVRSIVIGGSVRRSVCLSDCVSARVSEKTRIQISPNFLYVLPAAVAQSFSDNIAIRYVLPDGLVDDFYPRSASLMRGY